MDRREILSKCVVCKIKPNCNIFECVRTGKADECEDLKHWQNLVDYIEGLEKQIETLTRENFGLKTRVANLKEKEEKRYKYEGWND